MSEGQGSQVFQRTLEVGTLVGISEIQAFQPKEFDITEALEDASKSVPGDPNRLRLSEPQ